MRPGSTGGYHLRTETSSPWRRQSIRPMGRRRKLRRHCDGFRPVASARLAWKRRGRRPVKMTPEQLTDGPWCPDAASPGRYDADLCASAECAPRCGMRQTPHSGAARDRSLSSPGTSTGGERYLPTRKSSLTSHLAIYALALSRSRSGAGRRAPSGLGPTRGSRAWARSGATREGRGVQRGSRARSSRKGPREKCKAGRGAARGGGARQGPTRGSRAWARSGATREGRGSNAAAALSARRALARMQGRSRSGARGGGAPLGRGPTRGSRAWARSGAT